ncbi:MAG: twin-arginine translocation signal domain-containing protein, partial [Candidatus Sericytochromatia bacterium]
DFEQKILAPVTRRTFMKGVGAVAATMALPSLFTGAQAEAAGWLEQARRGAVTLGLDRLARAAAESEQALAAGQAPAEGFEGAAWRLQAILAEAKLLVPKLVAPAEEFSLLRARAQEAEALATLWKSLFLADEPDEVTQAVTEAVFAATSAERVFVLGRSLEPLASRSREAGELPYSPALVRLDLCRSAMEHGWAVASEPAVDAVAQPIVAERPWGVIYAVGAGEAEFEHARGEEAAGGEDEGQGRHGRYTSLARTGPAGA